jgi:hypothetical protein
MNIVVFEIQKYLFEDATIIVKMHLSFINKKIKDMKTIFFSITVVVFFTVVFSGCEKDDKKDEKKPLVKACFNYVATEVDTGEVDFINCSENATHYLWNFGDGDTSIEKEPKHTFKGEFPFYVSLIAYDEITSDTTIMPVYDEILVYKPNIYIYPQKPISLCVDIAFPIGGRIVQSIPEYNNGWCVTIDSSGLINNQFKYLFYESAQADIFQHQNGWCIAKSDLKAFFEKNMSLYNFSKPEIVDFIDYWIPRLEENNYYLIYPQTNEIIDKTIQVKFSIEPHNVNRLFYGIKGINSYSKIDEPAIVKFNRDGFTVMEWGVFLK